MKCSVSLALGGGLLALLLVGVQDATAQNNGFGGIPAADLHKLLSDKAFIKKQLDCVLAKGACDNTGNQLKLAIPEVLLRNCKSCNAQQAENSRKVVKFIQSNYPQEWTQIQGKFKSLAQKNKKN